SPRRGWQDILGQDTASDRPRRLGQLTVVNPFLKKVDPSGWPGAIAWHRADTQSLTDLVRILRHIIIVGQIESALHRLYVFVTKQRPNIGGKAGLRHYNPPPRRLPNTPLSGAAVMLIWSIACPAPYAALSRTLFKSRITMVTAIASP